VWLPPICICGRQCPSLNRSARTARGQTAGAGRPTGVAACWFMTTRVSGRRTTTVASRLNRINDWSRSHLILHSTSSRSPARLIFQSLRSFLATRGYAGTVPYYTAVQKNPDPYEISKYNFNKYWPILIFFCTGNLQSLSNVHICKLRILVKQVNSTATIYIMCPKPEQKTEHICIAP